MTKSPHSSDSSTLTTSVVIATRNRAEMLEEALQSIVDQTLCPTEVVLVDNASTDQTPEVADRFRSKLNLVYVIEPQLGVAHARNRGIATARGDIVAFIDDDCLPDPEWLQNMVWRFESDPSIGVVGGVTQARRPKSRSWVAKFCFELFSRSEESHPCS